MADSTRNQRVLALFGLVSKKPTLRDVSATARPAGRFRFDPEISVLKGRGESFSVFRPSHARLSWEAIKVMIQAASLEDFEARARLLRTITNSDLYHYVLTVATQHWAPTRGMKLPAVFQLQSRRFFSDTVFREVAEQEFASEDPPPTEIRISLDHTGTDDDPEHAVAYFREDIGINSHHWHWHTVYPWRWDSADVKGEVKDRKGELFYYMHRQMLARYDAERLSVGLERVVTLDNWHNPIMEGYAPHMTDGSGKPFADRPSGLTRKDIPGEVSLQDLENYRIRILDAIRAGYAFKTNGDRVPLDIDVLGDIVEQAIESPNTAFYGGAAGIHNFGHVSLSAIQDPDGRYKIQNPGGVMGDSATAIRDPVFFRWHKFIDDLFEQYQMTLTPYEEAELTWSGMTVKSVNLSTGDKPVSTNIAFRTFDLSHGFAFQGREKIKVTMPHLDHSSFYYKIDVENRTGRPQTATVRIFLAPTSVDAGGKYPMSMAEYRTLCIELDKFTEKIPASSNSNHTIIRKSEDSSVTIPWQQTIESLNDEDKNNPKEKYCGCGWPAHMLVPRGQPEGMEFSVFVMLTNWEEDKVFLKTSVCESCADASSYCGILNEKYPDKRRMGFPFDRPIGNAAVMTLEGFIEGKPNMAVEKVTIKYLGVQ